MPTTYADPGAFPLASPTISGTTVTVDLALQQPTRITRRIADITLERFIATRIFAQGGGVSGGAVVFDQAVLNELYLTRDVEQRAPGASNRVTAGTAYAVASQQVGELRMEQPLQTETYREPKTRRTWVQSSIKPVMYVTNPMAVRKITGLAG
jgi:hypothetical protein